MTQPTVLIVEDDVTIASVLADYLQQAGYQSVIHADGSQVVQTVSDSPPALVLLDIMLPEKDGLTICRELRAFSTVPIIMVTARVDDIDRLLGLELGADDYVCKPFLPKEVVARVRAVLRRVQVATTTEQTDHVHRYNGIELDTQRHTCSVNNKAVVLTNVEFRMLTTLIAQPGRVYSRTQLMQRSYEGGRIVSDRTIDTHVKNLRKKLAAVAPQDEWVHSVYGVGYKLE